VPRILVGVGTATVLRTPSPQNPAQRDRVGSKEGHPLGIEQTRRGQRGLTIVELGKGDLTRGVDDGLRVNPPPALKPADGEGVLRPALPPTFALKLSVGFLLHLRFLSGGPLGFSQEMAFLCDLRF